MCGTEGSHGGALARRDGEQEEELEQGRERERRKGGKVFNEMSLTWRGRGNNRLEALSPSKSGRLRLFLF